MRTFILNKTTLQRVIANNQLKKALLAIINHGMTRRLTGCLTQGKSFSLSRHRQRLLSAR